MRVDNDLVAQQLIPTAGRVLSLVRHQWFALVEGSIVAVQNVMTHLHERRSPAGSATVLPPGETNTL